MKKIARTSMWHSTAVIAWCLLLTFMLSNKAAAQGTTTYGIFADSSAFTLEGNFLTDTSIPTTEIDLNDDATYRIVSNSDSAYAGDNSMLVNFGGGKSDKVKFQFDADPADMSQFNNGGELVFFIKLLDTLDLSLEVSALRDGVEVNGSDVSLEEVHGLDRFNITDWQEFRVELDTIDGRDFDYSQFEYIGFRSRYNASSFLVDEIYVEYETAAAGIADASAIPDRLKLSQNYPNPFNPTTDITFDISQMAHVKLVVYNVSGQTVATLVDRELDPDNYVIQFNAGHLASGIYFYRLETDNFASTRKMLLLK